MTTPDDRFARYLSWLDQYFGGDYPADVVDKQSRQVAVRFLDALDSAVHLLSDSQLDRLLRLLEYLDAQHGFFFTPAATARCAELPSSDFSFLVTRQIAIVVAARHVSVEERATWWQLGFCGDAKRGRHPHDGR